MTDHDADTSPGQVRRFDHVAIAVPSLPEAVGLVRDVLGGTFIAGGDDEGLGIRTIQYKLPPGIKIELMQPVRQDSFLQRFLDRHGPGFHHATVFVDDLAAAISRLETAGFDVVDTDWSRPAWKETFVRPSSGFGTLLQVAQTTRDWSVPVDPTLTEDEVLAGEVVWIQDDPIRRAVLDT